MCFYENEASLKDKIGTIASQIYGADGVTYTPAALKALKRMEEMGFGIFRMHGKNPVLPVG